MKIIAEKYQKGITLYLAVITLSAALATALFVAGSLTKEYKISTELSNSLKAVYVADSVTEYTLHQVRLAPYAIDAFTQTADITVTLPNATVVKLSCPVNQVSGLPECLSSTAQISSLPLITILPPETCAPIVGIIKGSCSIEGELIAAGTATCPLTALNCVYLKANGCYEGTNRAMEIVYENK